MSMHNVFKIKPSTKTQMRVITGGAISPLSTSVEAIGKRIADMVIVGY